MKIYICLPEEIFSGRIFDEHRENIRSGLRKSLKRFYGNFSASDIEFTAGNENIDVYVMDKARHAGTESGIKEAIERSISPLLSGMPEVSVNIRLNYQALNPDFRPGPRKHAVHEDKKPASEEFDYNRLSFNYQAETPHYSFEQVILPKETLEQILEAVAVIQVEPKVFDEWGLRSVIPCATSAVSFYGPPGTGKTMAAEAVAHRLGKKIIRATYADIESKFHGEGPKMVKAIFRAAEREDAVLFLDESDSLLSKRLTNVTDGSAQAINSMRSQLLICLEQFKGIVIFATNLVVNYDQAFLSRLISIEFPAPDLEARKSIWERHIRGKGIRIPLSDDVNAEELAERYEFCGREIKNAVKDACVAVAMNGRDTVTREDFLKSCEKIKTESEKVINASDHTQSRKPTPKQAVILKGLIEEHIKQ